ncbi:growth factor receptor-bound proteinisoform X4 [Pontoporia blainvillei]|uniref:Growth factor receptor-bound proteinisoform X4 n=1 Tax=Pontoporia blainvillei TaxID=48723 RepID=A0ABX0S666_PONBL|nr:growth factor receptor-bound proteinisoform X4 [Pontoporia blainvillei]
MALAGGPDSFLHHPYYQDQVEQTSPRRPGNLAGPGFAAPPDRLANHQGVCSRRTSSLRRASPTPSLSSAAPGAPPALTPGSLPPGPAAAKQDVKVFSEDGTRKVVEILADTTARDLCQLLVYRSHCVDDNSWTLVEHHPHLGLERCLEDHELVVQGASKEPKHLQLLADLEDSRIFSLMAGRKQYGAPTDYGFCIKPNRVRNEAKELRLLCAEDEQSRMCWMTAFRLLKYGMLPYQNYRILHQRKAVLSPFSTPARSVSENSLVAMDFSGQTGRVIKKPAEAQSAALEEGHAWRKRSTRMNILESQSPSTIPA